MAKLSPEEAQNNCFEVALPYGIGENYLTPHAMVRGMFVFNEWSGRHRLSRPTYQQKEPGLIAEYGGRYPVQLYQICGERLNHHSMDLTFELMRQALALGYLPHERIIIRFDADEMLAALGKSRGGNNRQWLADELTRLGTARFRLTSPGLKKWEFSIIGDLTGDDDSRDIKVAASYEVELSAKLVAVYGDGWGIIKGPAWRALLAQRDSLARMLLGYFESHKNPEPVAEADLQRRYGREKLRRKEWLAELAASLGNLKVATNWHTCELQGADVVVYKTAAAAAEAKKKPALKQTPVLKAEKPVADVVAAQAPAVEVLAPDVAAARAAELDAFLVGQDPFVVYILAHKHPERDLIERLMGAIYEMPIERKRQIAVEAWGAKTLDDVKQFVDEFLGI